MANPPLPSQPSQREVLPEKPFPATPEKLPPETGPATPVPAEAPPETTEASVSEAIASKKEEIKAEQTGEAPSTAAMSGQVVTSPPPVSGYVSVADLKNLENLPREEQVKYLTEIVYQKGLDRAIATVQHLNDPYLFDLLHDTLVDEIYQKLKGPRLKNK